ncbi:NAD-dependent malic enzyme [Anthocerotibacter panamensis]|uniref:NAD-dependent malic enzyme n=1 Tax=Anthocerotibacter panamensis TaxID=2857077 RepID=UPI001C402474|nr:NAD-dependent malic enzyme [Anthocerotibacter panamensis]
MPVLTPNPSYSQTLRLQLAKQPGALAKVVACIADAGGNLSDISLIESTSQATVQEFVVEASSENHAQAIVCAVQELPGIHFIDAQDRTFALHRGGKISVESRSPLKTQDQLSRGYTPGVGRVCQAIHKDPSKAFEYTIKPHTVAIVTDGSAVLGLGNIGPLAALPVMEGKAMIFKEFAGLDAFPVCLDTQDSDAIVEAVRQIAPVFGAVNLEDISAPRCFEIEARLKKLLDIPVFHDDQHGTAVVLLAALLNALALTGKDLSQIKIVFNGVGAAGVACTEMLLAAGATHIVGCDRTGAIYSGRTANMNSVKEHYAQITNPKGEQGTLAEVLHKADVFVGLSGPGLVTLADIQGMAQDPIVFALANPIPEIAPEECGPYVAVMATGRSDYPNQINNALAYPGIFKGAMKCRATEINEAMKQAAAQAIAQLIPPSERTAQYIIPSVFDPRVVPAVAQAVEKAARATGVACS